MGERTAGMMQGCGFAVLVALMLCLASCCGLWGLGVSIEAQQDRDEAEAMRYR